MSLDTAFAALSDPTRRAILARLALGETSVTELAKPFAMSLPAVSKHLKVLERAGLIARGREAQWRPCRIEPRALKDIDDWLNHYRRFFDESFDRLDAYLQKLQAQGHDKGHDKDHDKARDRNRIDERSNDQPNARNRKSRRNKPRRS
ncbi:MAG: ArsR/SmtB family transcription factor [Xanthobacteraceae bacterium]